MKYRYLLFVTLFLVVERVVLAQSCPKWGPYAGAKNMDGDAELMMADVMVPDSGMAPFTYACSVQFKLGKSGGYCGIQDADGNDSARPFNNIFSVWDYPNKIQITHTYKDPMTFVGGFGNEGTGLHSHCDFGWKPDRWYTNVIRRWTDGGDKTFVAYFIFDQFHNEWRHYVTFAVPEKNAMLHGNLSSFLENFADDSKHTRSAAYKAYWKLLTNGSWVHPDSIEGNAGEGNWRCAAYGQDGITLTSCGKEMINGTKQVFAVHETRRQPAIFSAGEVYDLGAYYDKSAKKIVVDWSLKVSHAPQLSYQLQLFDSSQGGRKLLAKTSGFGPEVREAVLLSNGLAASAKTYYIVLTITDIFGNKVPAKEMALEELKP